MAVKVLIDITEEGTIAEIKGTGEEILVRLTELFMENQKLRQLFDIAIHASMDLEEELNNEFKKDEPIKTEE